MELYVAWVWYGDIEEDEFLEGLQEDYDEFEEFHNRFMKSRYL